MKFTSFSLLALGLSGAIAAPAEVEKRSGVQSLVQAFAKITSAVNSVESAVSSYNGGVPAQIASASSDVISSTKQAIQVAHSAGHLSQSDALQLTSPVQGIIKKTQSIVSTLDGKKSQIEAAGACQAVLSSLEQQKSVSNQLTQAVDADLPKSLQTLSAKLSGQIVTALDKAIKTYQSCQNSSGGGGGSSATATAPANTMTAAPPSSSAPSSAAPSAASSAASSVASAAPTSSAAPMPSSSASASASAPSSSPSSFKGAASKGQVSYGLGAVAAVLALVA